MLSSEVSHGTSPHPGFPPAAPGGDPLRISSSDGVVVLTLVGELDSRVGARLCEAAATAVADDAERLDIDLRGVERFTPEGASYLVACRDLTTALAQGLHYRTGRGPGREALLAAYHRHPSS